jgi:hypothetical protein
MTSVPRLRLLDKREVDPTPVANATRWQIMVGRLGETVAHLLNRLGCPAAIQPMNYRDGLTGDEIEITLRHSYSVISINGRDFYFDRVTGRFGGTGSGCRQPMR